MNIWFLTTVLPHLVTSGGEIASQAFVDALRALGHETTVFGYVRDDISQSVPEGSIVVAKRPIETASAGLKPYLWMAKAILRAAPMSARNSILQATARFWMEPMPARNPT